VAAADRPGPPRPAKIAAPPPAKTTAPPPATSATGAAKAATRPPTADPFSVRGVRGPLVGRNLELKQLVEVVDAAVDFRAPQLITILGNQGTGKSRLVDELVRRAEGRGVRVFTAHAVDGGPRYGVVVRYLRQRFSLVESAPKGARKVSLRRQVEELFGGEPIAEVVHFLGHFLDLHFPDSPFLRVLGENPAQHDEIARTVLRRLIEVDAEKGPLLLVFDDLQWADDDSLELLAELGAKLGGSPVILVACARPELMFRFSNWGAGATDHCRIDLRNLAASDAETLFRNLLARAGELPEDVVDDAVEMTGGNPYFLEQLVRLFHSNGTIDTSKERWVLDPDRAQSTELPISIEEAIEARIAALETPERELLEKGAVFGNVFWLGAVVALTRMEEDTDHDGALRELPEDPLDIEWGDEPLRKRIEIVAQDLVERDYLLRLEYADSTIAGDVELVFKHNLERELIAQSTDGAKLERYHRLAAQWLESKLLDRSEEQLEFLAQLYERGGERRRAAQCFLAGGDKARARYANEQAIELYRRGLETIGEDEPVARMDALHNLGTVLVTMGETEEARLRFREMLGWAWKVDHQAKGGAAHGRLGRLHRARGEYDRAMAHLRRAHELFDRADDKRGMASTLDDMGRVHWLRGAYGQALEFHRQALAIRRAIGDRRSIALSLANIGRVHHDQGAFKAAHRQFREALDLRRDIGDMSGVVESLCDLGGVHTADGSFELALEMLGEAYQIANDIGDRVAQCEVLSRIGAARSRMGDGTAAVEHLMEGISIASQLGHRALLADCRLRLAEVYVAMGDSGQASDQAERALTVAENIGSRALVGSCHRVLAESLAMNPRGPDDLAQAEEHFRRAVDILAGMKNELGLARTYYSFSQFCASAGRGAESAKLRVRADEIYGRLRGAAAID
jgi:tetratricopeptide (TPR) repeat protein